MNRQDGLTNSSDNWGDVNLNRNGPGGMVELMPRGWTIMD